jgi:hypothetical protein
MFKVINDFIDKETMEKHIVGSDYTPSSAKRGKELIEKGFIKEVVKPKKPSKKSDK